jgi:hypothetical protein
MHPPAAAPAAAPAASAAPSAAPSASTGGPRPKIKIKLGKKGGGG